MRYIDADALIKKIYPMGIGDGKYTINAKAIKLAIDNTPTADVVPKSEVERWRRNLEAVLEEIPETKREVAREIFEEIEKYIASMKYNANTPRKTVKVEELKEQVDWVLHEVVPNTIAELKKKYTEGKT